MKLWSLHPKAFRLDVPNLRLDHTKGGYWNNESSYRDNYRKALPELHRRLGTDQLLWSFALETDFRYFKEWNQMKWLMDVPDDRVVFYRDDEWHKILYNGQDRWEDLIVDVTPEVAVNFNIEALVKGPFNPSWFTCLGEPPIRTKIPESLPNFP